MSEKNDAIITAGPMINMTEQLEAIKKSYDTSINTISKGKTPDLPDEIKNSSNYKGIQDDLKYLTLQAPEVKEFLNPQKNMKFLDAGCCGDLAGYELYKWPSLYYGVDISEKFIRLMKAFVKSQGLTIGGLFVSEITKMPFEDNFFDIAACVGVFEYLSIEYIDESLRELYRCLKPNGLLVVNNPNPDHPYLEDMLKLEEFLGRTNFVYPMAQLEKIIKNYFVIIKTDNSKVLSSFFLQRKD